mmetsp:Transcript_26577/g.92379  ORF Transcript_26577/g.92379 Transcript_26577/m.92379 type:complete len:246 (+) Transcript_26577:1288-2025(+)
MTMFITAARSSRKSSSAVPYMLSITSSNLARSVARASFRRSRPASSAAVVPCTATPRPLSCRSSELELAPLSIGMSAKSSAEPTATTSSLPSLPSTADGIGVEPLATAALASLSSSSLRRPSKPRREGSATSTREDGVPGSAPAFDSPAPSRSAAAAARLPLPAPPRPLTSASPFADSSSDARRAAGSVPPVPPVSPYVLLRLPPALIGGSSVRRSPSSAAEPDAAAPFASALLSSPPPSLPSPL